QGNVTKVEVNGQVWTDFTAEQIELPFDQVTDESHIDITLGYPPRDQTPLAVSPTSRPSSAARAAPAAPAAPAEFADRAAKLQHFIGVMVKLNESHSYETAHARLALRAIEVIAERQSLLKDKKIP